MSEIPNGLRADIMRKRMLDKNTLSSAGSLYMGTGELEVGTQQSDSTEQVYKVTQLPRGENNQVLIHKYSNSDVLLPEWASYKDIKWTLANITDNNDFNTLTGFSRDSEKIEVTGEEFVINVSNLVEAGYKSIFVWFDTKFNTSSSLYTFVPGLIALRDLPHRDSDFDVKKNYFFKYQNTTYPCTILCSFQNGETTINFNMGGGEVEAAYALLV